MTRSSLTRIGRWHPPRGRTLSPADGTRSPARGWLSYAARRLITTAPAPRRKAPARAIRGALDPVCGSVSELAAGVVVLLLEVSVEDWYVEEVCDGGVAGCVEDWYVDEACAGGAVDSTELVEVDDELVELEDIVPDVVVPLLPALTVLSIGGEVTVPVAFGVAASVEGRLLVDEFSTAAEVVVPPVSAVVAVLCAQPAQRKAAPRTSAAAH